MIDYFLRSISSKLKLFILMAVLILVTIYPGIVKAYWGGTFAQIYANPIFRLPEFIIGMCVAQICLRKKERHFVRYSENSSPFLCASDQHRCAVLSNLF